MFVRVEPPGCEPDAGAAERQPSGQDEQRAAEIELALSRVAGVGDELAIVDVSGGSRAGRMLGALGFPTTLPG